MPLFSLLRIVFALMSLALLAAGGWLIWSWLEGVTLLGDAGRAYQVREDWRLWAGAGLLGWSFLGRFVVGLFLARADTDPSRLLRGRGAMVQSPTGSSLFVETAGPDDAPTMVLTHGWGMDSTIWYYAKRTLGDKHRVVTWDLAGLGRSQAADDGVSLPAFATDLRAVIESVSPQAPVILVGHSIGGMTVQTLARDHPAFFRERVAGAVLVNTTHTNPLTTMVFSGMMRALQKPLLEPVMKLAAMLQPVLWLAAWQSWLSGATHCAMRFGFGRFVTRSQLNHASLLATRNPPGVQARGNLAMFHWDATDVLQDIPGPVLVLAGDMDIVTKVEASETIARCVPEARLSVIEGVNHMGFLELADLYNAEIAAFAEAHRPAMAPLRLTGATTS